jgi:hypothetical protein
MIFTLADRFPTLSSRLTLHPGDLAALHVARRVVSAPGAGAESRKLAT